MDISIKFVDMMMHPYLTIMMKAFLVTTSLHCHMRIWMYMSGYSGPNILTFNFWNYSCIFNSSVGEPLITRRVQ